ncbi:MAG: cytochrome c [Pseudomonadota bacterium]
MNKICGPALALLMLASGAAPAAGEAPQGEKIYATVCQACHMAGGVGATGAGSYPALANNPRLAAKQYPLMLVINGSRAMPGFARMLSAEQIADVVNYVRTHFGNGYTDTVTPAEVRALLPQAKTGE